MIEQHEYRLLSHFIFENWYRFCKYGAEQNFRESQLEDLFGKLEEKANG